MRASWCSRFMMLLAIACAACSDDGGDGGSGGSAASGAGGSGGTGNSAGAGASGGSAGSSGSSGSGGSAGSGGASCADPEAALPVWFFATPSQELYVSPDGDDQNDGSSPAQALKTTAAAFAKLTPGTRLNFATGSYWAA